jgi:hypothetical protein
LLKKIQKWLKNTKMAEIVNVIKIKWNKRILLKLQFYSKSDQNKIFEK